MQSQLLTTRGLFSSYLRIRSLHQQNSSSSSNESPELNSARLDLLAALDDLREDVNDLADAVRAAEKEPAAFGLDGVEVSRRRREVLEIQGEVEDMAEEVSNADRHSAAEQQKHPFPRHRRVGSKGSNSKLPDPGAFAVMEADGSGGHAQGSGAGARRRQGQEDGEDYAAEFEHQTQQMLMREQDEQLDSVYVTVGTLRNMADDMGRELNEQTEMLDHTGTLADRGEIFNFYFHVSTLLSFPFFTGF